MVVVVALGVDGGDKAKHGGITGRGEDHKVSQTINASFSASTNVFVLVMPGEKQEPMLSDGRSIVLASSMLRWPTVRETIPQLALLDRLPFLQCRQEHHATVS